MFKARFLIPLVLAATVLSASPARAGGWGPYFSWSHSMPNTSVPDWVIDLAPIYTRGILRTAKLNLEQDHITVGVLYDSAPSRDKLFNFRMTLGVDFATSGQITGFEPNNALKIPYVSLLKTSLDSMLDTTGYGGTMKFTFGFAPIRTQLLKWWLGPCLYVSGNYHSADIPIPTIAGIPAGLRLKHGGTVRLGGGVESGVNFHVTSFLSLGITGGFLWNAYGMGAALEDPSGTVPAGAMVWGDGPMFLIQISALFHTGDDRGAWK